jgi:hypothetical protein
VAVLMERAPASAADAFWPPVHGMERVALPALPDALELLEARGRAPTVTRITIEPRRFESRDVLASGRGGSMTRAEAIPPEVFLEGYADDIRETANRLRAVVKRAVPDATERVRPGWALIGYDLPVRGKSVYFAWVWPERKHVHLGFEHGIFMDDPQRVLQGAHLKLKKVRYVTVDPGHNFPEDTYAELTRHAADIAALPQGARSSLLHDRE